MHTRQNTVARSSFQSFLPCISCKWVFFQIDIWYSLILESYNALTDNRKVFSYTRLLGQTIWALFLSFNKLLLITTFFNGLISLLFGERSALTILKSIPLTWWNFKNIMVFGWYPERLLYQNYFGFNTYLCNNFLNCFDHMLFYYVKCSLSAYGSA